MLFEAGGMMAVFFTIFEQNNLIFLSHLNKISVKQRRGAALPGLNYYASNIMEKNEFQKFEYLKNYCYFSYVKPKWHNV